MQNLTIVILTYVVLYQLSSRTSVRPVVSASILALTPLVYELIIRAVKNTNLPILIGWIDLILLILQFAAAYIVFTRLDNDDSHTTWLVWGAGGLIIIAILIPISLLFLLSF